MPDEIGRAYMEGLAANGPEWLIIGVTIAVVLAIIYFKIVPSILSVRERRISIEEKRAEVEMGLERTREARKERESKSREQRDQERSKMEGRWIQSMEQQQQIQQDTNTAINGIKASMDVLASAIHTSQQGSQTMRDELHESAVKIGDIHTKIMEGGEQ